MPSMQTVFRLVVMVVVGAIVVKGWKLYGPPNEQVQAAAAHAQEFVQSKLGNDKPAAVNAISDPRPGSTLSPAAPVIPAMPLAPAAPLTQREAPRLLPSAD